MVGHVLDVEPEILSNKYCAVLRIDDEVVIRNCPPVSARKRFILDQILRSPETQHELMHKNVATNSQTVTN